MEVDDIVDDDDLASTMDQVVAPHVQVGPAPLPLAPEGWTTRYLLAVLVLIAAGGAAAVVYFALP
jgi:hypothetical protein